MGLGRLPDVKITDWVKTYIPAAAPLVYDPQSDLSNPLWNELAQASDPTQNGLSLTGVIPSDQSPPINQGPTTQQVDTSTLLAIQQSRTTGFDVTDIRPFYLSLSSFRCSLPASVLQDKFGDWAENFVANLPLVGSHWRTIPISKAGNYLRIDLLPNRQMGFTSAALHGTAGNLNVPLEVGPNFAPPSITSPLQNWNDGDYTFSNIVLVQLESPNAPIIMMKFGDFIKCPFQQVFITCCISTPAFSLITGFNTEYQPAFDQRMMSSQPAFGPGLGLWDATQNMHCVPFTFSSGNQGVPASNTVNAATTQTTTLVSNTIDPDPNLANPGTFTIPGGGITGTPPNRGVVTGWITNFNIAVGCNSNNASAQEIFGGFQLRQQCGNGLSTNFRLIGSVPFEMFLGPGNTTIQSGYSNMPISYALPRRFSLTPGDSLALIIRNASSALAISAQWSVDGYFYGPANVRGTAGGNPTTFNPAQFVCGGTPMNVAPFPFDYKYGSSLL